LSIVGFALIASVEQLRKESLVSATEEIKDPGVSSLQETIQSLTARSARQLVGYFVNNCELETEGGELFQKIVRPVSIKVSGVQLEDDGNLWILADWPMHTRQRSRFCPFDVYLDELGLDVLVLEEFVQRHRKNCDL
jgi:hypothetical protein